jgi:hypothetical protein
MRDISRCNILAALSFAGKMSVDDLAAIGDVLPGAIKLLSAGRDGSYVGGVCL